ncbi:MAG TPA: hypothetical protein PLM98_08935, partial [Thiolinea sp.]|nr:hypothetical protein [Thiolinea sp.]
MSNLESNELLEEARHLLPWYLTDKLSKAEQGLVNQALELFPELQLELAQEEKMMRVVRTNTSLLELSALDTTEQRLNKLLARIDREDEKLEETSLAVDSLTHSSTSPSVVVEQAPTLTKSKKSWLDFLWREPLFNLNWLTPANAVFASLLLVQGALLAYNSINPASDNNTFIVANVESTQPAVNTNGQAEVSRF